MLRATFNQGDALHACFHGSEELSASLGSTVYLPELYAGPYDVTPSEALQTLMTEGFGMAQNVTIQPIPSEYIVPSGTITITQNEIVDVGEYANADVAVADDFLWAGGEYF